MAVLASDVMTEAAALLNDQGMTNFNTTNMLPFIKKANDELQLDLALIGISVIKEIYALTTIPQLADPVGTLSMVFPNPPTDMIVPVALEERKLGDTGVFTPMRQKDWEPNVSAVQTLRFWAWREMEIKLRGAIQDNEVRLKYIKVLTPIVGASTPLVDALTKTTLAARTAALAAAFWGEDFERATALKDDADEWKEKYIALCVNQKQSVVARRKPFRAHR